MKNLFLFTCMLLLSISSNSHADNISNQTSDAVKKLNDIYSSEYMACNIYLNLLTSPIDCSGVMIHGIEVGQRYVWIPDQTDLRKAVSFSYVRSDLPTSILFGPAGFVYDQTVRNASATKLIFYCFYPFDAVSSDSELHPSNFHGCGLPDTKYAGNTNSEFASCPDASVKTADDFINRYLVDGNSQMILPVACSFSANQVQSFSEVLKVQKKTSSPYWNELITSTWNAAQAEKLPIIAFIYLAGKNEGLSAALGHQKDYCDMYGKFMPVIKLDLSKKNDQAFSGNMAEQQPCT